MISCLAQRNLFKKRTDKTTFVNISIELPCHYFSYYVNAFLFQGIVSNITLGVDILTDWEIYPLNSSPRHFTWSRKDVPQLLQGKTLVVIFCHMLYVPAMSTNSLRPRQNGWHFADNIFKCISFSLRFVPKGPINNIPALVQIMAWRRPDDKPLSEKNGGYITDAYRHHSASMS